MNATQLKAYVVYRSVMADRPLPLAVERKRGVTLGGSGASFEGRGTITPSPQHRTGDSALPSIATPLPGLALVIVTSAAGIFFLAVYGAFKLLSLVFGS